LAEQKREKEVFKNGREKRDERRRVVCVCQGESVAISILIYFLSLVSNSSLSSLAVCSHSAQHLYSFIKYSLEAKKLLSSLASFVNFNFNFISSSSLSSAEFLFDCFSLQGFSEIFLFFIYKREREREESESACV
jgi:hypothetical protein